MFQSTSTKNNHNGGRPRGLRFLLVHKIVGSHHHNGPSTSLGPLAKTLSDELAELSSFDSFSIDDEEEASTVDLTIQSGEPNIRVVHDFILELVESMRGNNHSRRGKRKNLNTFTRICTEEIPSKIREECNSFVIVTNDPLQARLKQSQLLIEQVFEMIWDQVVLMNDYLPETMQEECRYNAENFVFSAFESHIFQQITTYKPTKDLTPGESAQIINWIEAFLSIMQRQYGSITISEQWKKLLHDAQTQYILELRQELRTWMQRSIRSISDDDIRKNQLDGKPITGHPEDILFIVNSQISVAIKHLPQSYVEKILMTCNEEIAVMVSDLMLEVGSRWRETSTARFCSIINDSVRLSDFLEQCNEEHLKNDKARAHGVSVICDLAELSMYATEFLCERILCDLTETEKVLCNIGSPDWETDESGFIIDRTIATFRDFMEYLQRWLSTEYFFPKVLNRLFHRTLQTYIFSFYGNTMQNGIRDAKRVSDCLKRDYESLVVFFNGFVFENYAGRAGLISMQDMNARLQVIQSMSRIAAPAIQPADLQDDVRAVLSLTMRCNERNAPVILHLVGLRGYQNRAQSIEWLQMIARSERTLHRVDDVHCHSDMIKLPDLRNSRYIHNIRFPKQEIYRGISAQSVKSLDAIKEMMTNVGPKTKLRNLINQSSTVPELLRPITKKFT
jgi:hypothetical protein